MSRPDPLGTLPFSDWADPDPTGQLRIGDDDMNANCAHCGRGIILSAGRWIDPEATGDDSVWSETCDAHDTFTAEHEADQ